MKGRRQGGFTLVELMIALIVLAILVALAYPSYTQYVRKAKRGEAQELLMNWSVNQEIYRSNNPTYAGTGAMAPPTHATFQFNTVGTPDETSYVLVAQAQGDQLKDKEKGNDCDRLTIDQNGAKGPIVCWGGRS
jgi:type IV pilus assembly protein PilE